MIFRTRRSHTHPAPSAPTTPSAPPARTENAVSVEDLLQFKKRAEQPAPEFWTDFERQFKERQRAAAIQEKRTWLDALPRIAFALPVGATAALAIGFIVWRNATPALAPAASTLAQQSPAIAENLQASTVAALATAPTHAEVAVNQQNQLRPETQETQPAARQITVASLPTPAAIQTATQTAAETAATQPVSPQHLEAARIAFASIVASHNYSSDNNINIAVFGNGKTQTTKTTSTTALFAMPAIISNELISQPSANTAYTTANAATPAPAEATPEEPLDSRRERLLTYVDNTIPTAAAANTSDNPRVTRLRDRVTSRFNDKTLSDSISRVATTGDSFTIKF